MTLHYFRRLQGEIRISWHSNSRSLARPVGQRGRSASPKDEKSARTLETPEGRRGVPKQPSNLRNGREKPWFEAPGTGKSKAGEGVGSLRFRPSFQGPALAANSPQCRCRHQIRKTNLSLQQLSINSNSHYFGEIMRSVHFRIPPVRLTDCQIRSSDLSGGVENQPPCTELRLQRGVPHYSLLRNVLQRSAR